MDVLPTRGDPRDRRNRYQRAVAALTGLAAAGSLTATGWMAGQAAHAWQAAHPTPSGSSGADNGKGDRAQSRPASATRGDGRDDEQPRIIVRQRPTRTRISTRYVAPAAPVGGGGTVRSTPSHTQAAPPAPSSGS